MTTKYPYPSEVLAEKLRDEGFSVQCCWEVKAKQAGIAWLVCYIVRGTSERPAYMPVMVQTFMDDGHWEAWLPAYDGVQIAPTVQAVIDRATKRIATETLVA